MENTNPKKRQPVGQNKPQKPARKKRRILLWLFLIFFVVGAAAFAAFYFRMIPLEPEMADKVEPYITQMESFVAKIQGGKKDNEQVPPGSPQTNFPLVDLDENKKNASPQIATPTPGLLGAPAVASASPNQPIGAAGAKPVATGKEAADTAKVYGKLAKLYSAMKPEEAVAVFSNLEEDQVVLILSRMDDESASKILASTEAKKAARLTQAMIKRK
jgi:hypothetical protein